jgi:hypothetical protein
MQENDSPNKKPTEPTIPENQDNEQTQPHKHNPFEDKNDTLTKEEEEAIEQFKEAQTERD